MAQSVRTVQGLQLCVIGASVLLGHAWAICMLVLVLEEGLLEGLACPPVRGWPCWTTRLRKAHGAENAVMQSAWWCIWQRARLLLTYWVC